MFSKKQMTYTLLVVIFFLQHKCPKFLYGISNVAFTKRYSRSVSDSAHWQQIVVEWYAPFLYKTTEPSYEVPQPLIQLSIIILFQRIFLPSLQGEFQPVFHLVILPSAYSIAVPLSRSVSFFSLMSLMNNERAWVYTSVQSWCQQITVTDVLQHMQTKNGQNIERHICTLPFTNHRNNCQKSKNSQQKWHAILTHNHWKSAKWFPRLIS